MKLNYKSLKVDKYLGIFIRISLESSRSTKSKIFYRKKTLQEYLIKLYQEESVKEEIRKSVYDFKSNLKTGQYIRLNQEIEYPDFVKDLIKVEDEFFGRKEDCFLAINEYVGKLISLVNEECKKNQIELYKDFFDTVESNPLTASQREACVSDQCNTLVLAGAGSGKTSVMIARIGYLVKSGLAIPEEILVLAFNSDAATELKDRVDKKLSDLSEIEKCHISTFHSLGKMIYDKSHNYSLGVAKHSSDETLYISIIEKLINESLIDSKFNSAFMIMYNAIYFPEPNYEQINSQEDYDIYINNIGLRSYKGDMLKGFGELAIANYLYLQGIPYKYEPLYSKVTGVDLGFNYNPDFYIIDKKVFLEHFGVDREGNTRKDISKEKYLREMEDKRRIHFENGTSLIESYHYEFLENVLESNLEKKLKEIGVEFNPISSEEIFNTINALEKRTSIGTEIANTINQIRTRDLSESEFEAKLNKQFDSYASKNITFVIFHILKKYNEYLVKNEEYTFEDMINRSSKLIKDRSYIPKWKYILVDEFQDISPQRAELIINLRDGQEDASLFCVGDDWQAINGFSGSELSYTVKFEEKVGQCETVLLDKTFRFDNQLCDLSSKFIMKNPNQKQKEITTYSQSESSAVILRAVENQNYLIEIKEILKSIPQKSTVLFLRRNKLGFNLKLNQLEEFKTKLDMSLMNMHSSKGLEADYVILLDVTSNISGIPSLIKNSKITKALLPTFDDYKYSEERRLFYVALTRAKKKCYLLTEYNAPSTFVFELIDNDYNIDIATVKLEKLYRPEECHRCNSDLSKLFSMAKNLYYKCIDDEYCNVMYYACIKCESPIRPNKDYYGCSNTNCSFGNKENLCKCCNYGIVIPGVSKTGNHYERCSYEDCLNPFQNKCIYCGDVFRNDKYQCQNVKCFTSNWKCPVCNSFVKKRVGKYGEFYSCSKKSCSWTQSKLRTL